MTEMKRAGTYEHIYADRVIAFSTHVVTGQSTRATSWMCVCVCDGRGVEVERTELPIGCHATRLSDRTVTSPHC